MVLRKDNFKSPLLRYELRGLDWLSSAAIIGRCLNVSKQREAILLLHFEGMGRIQLLQLKTGAFLLRGTESFLRS